MGVGRAISDGLWWQGLAPAREIAMEGMGEDDGSLSPILGPDPRYDVASVDVGYASQSDRLLRCREMTLWAMCGRLRVGKKNLHVAGLVGAAMCSAFECGSHDRWP